MPKKYKTMEFEDNKVSTQTFVIHTNLRNIDLSLLSDHVTNHITDDLVEGPTLPAIRSVGSRATRVFSNCVSMSFQVEVEKMVNAKLFNNGVLQLTGCKSYDHTKDTLIKLWSVLRDTSSLFTIDGPFEAYIVSVMRNIDFKLGFDVSREKLEQYIQAHTKYRVSPKVNDFMGVKISIPLGSVDDLDIHKVTINEEVTDVVMQYKDLFVLKPELKRKATNKSITISIFQTGKVLMSGIDVQYQKPYYTWFRNLMETIRPEVELKKNEVKSFRSYIK